MKIKALFLAAIVAAMSLSCTREAVESGQVDLGTEMRFTAGWADERNTDSRTVLREDGKSVWWMPGDEINLFFGDKASGKFISDNENPAAVVDFIGTLPIAIGSMETETDGLAFWAAYPYDAENSCDGEGITMSLPYIQEGTANGFADKFFPAVANSKTLELAFYNVCGGARFSVTQEGVIKVVFKSNDGSPMAGKVKVGFGGDNKPQILEFTNPVDSIVVNAPEGGFVPGTNYFAAMLPQAHVKGMTISLSTQYKKASRTLSNAVTVHRSLFGVLDNVDAGLEYDSCGYAVPEVVDLGLSVKWASFNLGATKPEEYGDYFAWGEIEPNWNYSWSTYKWCMGSEYTMTKYCNESDYGYNGFTDNKTVLDPEDDAAAVNLGGSWRMPTIAEQDELRSQCTWTWTTQNGVNGRLVTGLNGNSIFLPAAGYRYGTNLYSVGSYGSYWSSSLYTDYPYEAYGVYFNSSAMNRGSSYRYYGRSVRPVYGDFIHPESISLDKSELTLMEGCSANLSATISPSNTTNRHIIWTSSNTSIATVSSTGVVAGVEAGTAVITAKTEDGGLTASCEVTVVPFAAKTPEAVDLGLSVKWASFNLGATKPEEYGVYFAWGETEPKGNYSWSTYKWCMGSEFTMTKYCNKSDYGYNGFTDNKTVLDPEDDAAAVNLGGSWRMATYAEWDELKTKCTWTWTTRNGVNGRLITGPNGNSIFLPAAGRRSDTGLGYVGSYGGYWSSSLNTDWPCYAYYVYFNSDYVYWSNGNRFYGQSVRPVYDFVSVSGISLNKTTLSLSKGATETLTATVSPSDATNKSVTWSSSNTSVATVSTSGVVTAVAGGTATITVKTVDGNKTATCSVTVTEPVLVTWIALYSKNMGKEVTTLNMLPNDSDELTVVCYPTNATDKNTYTNISNQYWSSSHKYVACTKGLIYADGDLRSGYSEVKVVVNGKTATCIVKLLEAGVDDVNLGLSVRWMKRNVYTSSSTDFGPYYTFSKAKSKFASGTWRLPTKAEMEELVNNCTFTQSSGGWTATSKINGESVFFPLAGGIVDGMYYPHSVGGSTAYISSTTNQSNNNWYRLYFMLSSSAVVDDTSSTGSWSVRLVRE